MTGASCPLTAPDVPKIIASPTVPVIDMSVPASAAFISITAHIALVVPVVGLLSHDALQACAWTMVVTSPSISVTMQRPPYTWKYAVCVVAGSVAEARSTRVPRLAAFSAAAVV